MTLAPVEDRITVEHVDDPEPIVEPTPERSRAHPVSAALAIFAALVAAFGVFLFAGSGLSGQREQVVRDREFRSKLAMGRARIGGAIPVGTPIATLRIPELGLRQVVAEGSIASVTMGGPGHVRATPMPGQAGNAVVVARRSTFGAPFGDLGSLRAGDRVSVVTGQGPARYRITDVGTARADDPTLFASTSRQGRITLLTADPPLNPTGYLVARGVLVGTPAASTPHVRTITPAETGLAGERSGFVGLALGLLILIAAGAAGTWLFLRWRPWSAYIVVVPVVIAGAWVAFEAAARLLPATL